MERINALSRGMQLMLAASVLLLIDSFLDWQQVTFEFADVSESAGASGWSGIGIIMGLLTIALIAWLVLRLLDVQFSLPVSDAMVAGGLAALILLFTVIKFLVDSEARHWPAWVGLILAVLIAVGAWLTIQDAGGMNTLRTEASGMGGSRGSGGEATRTTTDASAAAPASQAAPATPPAAPPSAPTEPAAPPPSTSMPAEQPPAHTPPPPPDTTPSDEPRQ